MNYYLSDACQIAIKWFQFDEFDWHSYPYLYFVIVLEITPLVKQKG